MKLTMIMLGKGKFPREEGFLRGPLLQKNGAWKCFGESVLKYAFMDLTLKMNGPRGQ